ncbi:integrin alpha-M [Parambassis ranga]|uniref:Integrin alpha-M n=1 Tax=Parambassis ranga TaxID=210632 RepID=A0A6P7INQ9_9TELE|nr:integrin alpha-M-like [Parambassis ranga]
MHGLPATCLLTYLVTAAAVVPVSLAFYIDVTKPIIHTGDRDDFYGYKVLQFQSGDKKGIIVTAPLRLNGSGGICNPGLDQPNQCFQPKENPLSNTTVTKHLGLSIAADSTDSQTTFHVCSPSVAHECHGNSYLNSICYNITDELQQLSTFTPAFQKCTSKTVDLVFLFDGSGSMTEDEFYKNKEFIVDIMKSLKNSSIKFAAVQFSTNYRKVFNFTEYEAGTAHDKLMTEPHMKDLTNTHKALKYVLEEIFDSPDAGASPDATKVLVLITDGDPSDRDRDNIIKRYNEKNIIRFVIAVKNVNLKRFETIASKPENAFKIENYDGLTGVLENFQKKIFKMEGVVGALAGNLTNEMAQSGFSAVFHKDTLILGSVGSNSWRGSLQEHRGTTETQIEDPEMEMDSYMGYSVSVGQKNQVPLYFTGAPRFNHTGQVLLFKHDGINWTRAQRIKDGQIGSYFGAELCSVDINSDDDTDFLLVGAPLFYQPQQKKEGRIYIYTLTNEVQLQSVLNVTAPSTGRFGTSISSLKDLNGDGLRDVAVGAPFEDDNRGVVYIYLGDRHRGIRSTFSQRIEGEAVQSGIRFFGQAIDGSMDLEDDRLPDIVVGSQGTAVVLRSKPVINVVARMSFQPRQISTEKLYCPGNANEKLPMVTIEICFNMNEATKSDSEAIGLNITYMLNVDPMRQTNRGFFNQTDKTPRNLTSTYELINNETCFKYPIFMPKCVKDTLSPVTIKLQFFQPDKTTADAVLNEDNNVEAFIEVPFEKQCRKNDTCIAELEVDFNFTVSTLVVTENKYFNITARLANHGDDSYNTNLTMYYPPGISFSRMTLIEFTRPTLHDCRDQEALDKTICGVSHPVYRRGSSATFNISFYVTSNNEWNDTISMAIAGKSDNSPPTRNITVTKSIPVQYEIKMAITVSEDSTSYLNFTSDDVAPKQLITTYRIDNTGFKDFPANVSLFFTTNLEYNFEMNNHRVSVQKNKTQCRVNKHLKSEHCSSENCQAVVCDTLNLDRHEGVEITLTGDVQFRDLEKYAKNIHFLNRYSGESAKVTFQSKMVVTYDEQRYMLASQKHEKKDGGTPENNPTMKTADVRVEFTILPDKLLIIVTGTGLGVLLLIILTIILCKMGCFKRKTMQYYQEQEEEAEEEAALQASTAAAATAATSGSTNGNEEKEKLLGAAEANGSTTPAVTQEEEEEALTVSVAS